MEVEDRQYGREKEVETHQEVLKMIATTQQQVAAQMQANKEYFKYQNDQHLQQFAMFQHQIMMFMQQQQTELIGRESFERQTWRLTKKFLLKESLGMLIS